MKSILSISAVCALAMMCGGCGLMKVTLNVNSGGFAGHLYDYNIGLAEFNPNDPLLERRIISVSGGFNRAMADRLCTQLVYLDGQSKTETITLCINSGGGDGTAFLAIRNMINSISAPVDTVNMGFAGSNAANLFLSATGKRYCVKDSAFFIHDPSGTPKELVKQYVTLQENLLRTKCELPADWLPIKSRQFVICDQDALKYKICDAIIEKIDLDPTLYIAIPETQAAEVEGPIQ